MNKIHGLYCEVRAPFRKIVRVVQWIPTLWNNYDWDFHYIFIVLRYKLTRMEREIRLKGHASNRKQTADQIKVAVHLLDRICNDGYLENATSPVDREYGQWTFDFENNLEIVHKKPLTVKQKTQHKKDLRAAWKHSDYMIKQDKEYLFKYILKHHRQWWD